MGAEDAGEAVGRVGDLDLDPGQPAFEEGAGRRPGPAARIARCRSGRGARRRPARLQPVLFVAVDEVVVVVAGEEDEALAGQLLGDQRSRPVEDVDRVADRAEEEVEEVAEEDQLVDASSCGASRSRKNSSRSRSRPVQAPKWVSEMTSARKRCRV